MNPYLALNVPFDAGDQRIRKAYLDGIKQASPETNPKQFQLLAAAYEKIKDEPSRHRHRLFDKEPPAASPIEVLLQYVAHSPPPKPMPLPKLKAYLRECAQNPGSS